MAADKKSSQVCKMEVSGRVKEKKFRFRFCRTLYAPQPPLLGPNPTNGSQIIIFNRAGAGLGPSPDSVSGPNYTSPIKPGPDLFQSPRARFGLIDLKKSLVLFENCNSPTGSRLILAKPDGLEALNFQARARVEPDYLGPSQI